MTKKNPFKVTKKDRENVMDKLLEQPDVQSKVVIFALLIVMLDKKIIKEDEWSEYFEASKEMMKSIWRKDKKDLDTSVLFMKMMGGIK